MSTELDLIRTSLLGLPDLERQAFELWRYNRASFNAIGWVLNVSEIEARQAVVRATRHLLRAPESEAVT